MHWNRKTPSKGILRKEKGTFAGFRRGEEKNRLPQTGEKELDSPVLVGQIHGNDREPDFLPLPLGTNDTPRLDSAKVVLTIPALAFLLD